METRFRTESDRQEKSRRKTINRLKKISLIVFALGCFVVTGAGDSELWRQIYRWLHLYGGLSVQVEEGQTAFHFIDVGQGDATLIQSEGEFCLIDTGTRESEDQLVQHLDSAGVQKIKLLVITHPHSDHTGGLQRILEDFRVEQVLLPPMDGPGAEEASARERLLGILQEEDVPFVSAYAGQVFLIGSGSLTVLSAGLPAQTDEEKGVSEELNNLSVITRYEDENASLLCSGDAGQEAEEELLRRDPPDPVTVFQAGHHGSSTSNSEEFLAQLDPEVVVISCGLENDYGHPHESVLRRLEQIGAEIYRTDLQGSVILLFDRQDMTAYTSAENAA